MYKFTIGIDIGKTKGAFAIQENGEIKGLPMPKIGTELDYHKIFETLEPYKNGVGLCVFEDLGVIFGSSKKTALSMGHQAGAIEMACIALGIPFVKVKAKVWQKKMFVGIQEIKKTNGKRDTKAMALMAVKRRFPTLELTLTERATEPHDGFVDAVLMSEYAKTL